MDNIIVKKKNEVYLHIDCDPGIQHELADHFCFFVPGYKFMPAYKHKMWDGKIRLFDLRQKTLYGGLFQYLQEFADAREYQIVIDHNNIYGRPDIEKIVDVQSLLSQLNLSAGGKLIVPRDYQLLAVNKALSITKTLLLSPTASGKSLIIYLCIRYFLMHADKKVLLIVPTTSLVEQMYSDFADYSQFDEGFDVEQDCHKIYSGKEKYNISQRIVITTWQSIYKENMNWFENYGMVIGDEAHNFKAKSLCAILEKCHNAEYRIGTTGTLDGTQTHQLVLEGLFGKVFKVTSTKELMDSNNLAQLDISVLLLKHPDEVCKVVSKYNYQDEVDYIVRLDKRNNFITNLALDQDGNTLILFQFVDKHGKPLHDMLRKKIEGFNKTNRSVYYVSGETDVDSRESIRSIVETQSDAIIVASMGTFSTGVNIRNLHNIIFASPSKSQIKVLQSIGRGLRKSEDGRDTKLFDIADDLHWKSKKNYTLTHAAERIKIYNKEKFNYKVFEVNI